jgi:hypothetical protein
MRSGATTRVQDDSSKARRMLEAAFRPNGIDLNSAGRFKPVVSIRIDENRSTTQRLQPHPTIEIPENSEAETGLRARATMSAGRGARLSYRYTADRRHKPRLPRTIRHWPALPPQPKAQRRRDRQAKSQPSGKAGLLGTANESRRARTIQCLGRQIRQRAIGPSEAFRPGQGSRDLGFARSGN